MQRLLSGLIFATLALSATAPSQAAAPDVKCTGSTAAT